MHTLEGDVSYRRGDALLTGLKGERWPIERSKFENSYFPEPNTEPGAPGKYRKKPLVVWVLMLETPYSIEVGWKDDKIEGKEGDWLIQYDEDDFGIVESEVFKNSYEILT